MTTSRSSSSPSDLEQRRLRTAEIARRLRRFIGQRSRFGRGSSFIETLVATILSQNTSDVNSTRAYTELRSVYPTWYDVANAPHHELARVIRSGGLADQKARTILGVLNQIHELHGDFEPPHLDRTSDDELLRELTSMRGVGVKTAACVLMFSLGRDVCAVDTHIHRIANRLGIVHTSNADKTFHDLRPLVPAGKGREFHVDLIRFGRQICKAQRPHCFECPLYDLCAWEPKEEFARAGIPGPPPVSGDVLLLDVLPEREAGGAGSGRGSRLKGSVTKGEHRR